MGFTVNHIFNSAVKYSRRLLFLPRKGYKTITVTENVHRSMKKRAGEAKFTLKEYVEYLFDKDKVAEEGA